MTQRYISGHEMRAVAAFTLDSPELEDQHLDVARQTAQIVAFAVANCMSVERWFRGDVLTEDGSQCAPLLQSITRGETKTLLISDVDAIQKIIPQYSEVVDALQQAGGEIIAVRGALNLDTPIGQLLRTLVTACETYHGSLTRDVSPPMDSSLTRRLDKPRKGGIPFGYKMVTTLAVDGTEIRSIEIDEQAAQAIRRIFTLRRQQQPLEMIAQTLNNDGYRTSQGSIFCAKHISRVLHRQAVYEGRHGYYSDLLAGKYPAILTLEEKR